MIILGVSRWTTFLWWSITMDVLFRIDEVLTVRWWNIEQKNNIHRKSLPHVFFVFFFYTGYNHKYLQCQYAFYTRYNHVCFSLFPVLSTLARIPSTVNYYPYNTWYNLISIHDCTRCKKHKHWRNNFSVFEHISCPYNTVRYSNMSSQLNWTFLYNRSFMYDYLHKLYQLNL